MADFNLTWPKIKDNEGGYNPGDKTINETYMGIDRGYNPKWEGWKIIDSLKPRSTTAMNTALRSNIPLQSAITKFYKINYWDTVRLSDINDQQVADNLMDCSVNQGTGISTRNMQFACNGVIMHEGMKLTPLIVDGAIGAKTLAMVNILPSELVFNEINTLRRNRYLDIANKNPNKKVWLKTWLNRLVAYKH